MIDAWQMASGPVPKPIYHGDAQLPIDAPPYPICVPILNFANMVFWLDQTLWILNQKLRVEYLFGWVLFSEIW